MLIGVPREIKPQEGRVALLPAQVRELVSLGHVVIVERDAGLLSEAHVEDYAAAGAQLADDALGVYDDAELIVKVKEILPPEYAYLRSDHTLFTNIHAAANREQVDKLEKQLRAQGFPEGRVVARTAVVDAEETDDERCRFSAEGLKIFRDRRAPIPPRCIDLDVRGVPGPRLVPTATAQRT